VTFCLALLTPSKPLSILLWVAIAVGFCLFLFGFRLLARQRSLLTLSSAQINSAPRGLVEVSGLAAGPCTTMAPITGEPCFLYHTTVWQQHDSEKNGWEKVAEETLHVPFFIRDSTGQLLIEARGADLELHPRFRGEYAAALFDSNDIPESVSGFLSRHAVAPDHNLCIEERLIKAEDELFVTGTLAENPALQAPPFSPRSEPRADHRNPVRDLVPNTVPNTDRNLDDESRDHAHSHPLGPLPAPEVIRLVSAAPSSTREMTQQAKIAAALSRAGMGNPQAWSSSRSFEAQALEENAPSPTTSARYEVLLRQLPPRNGRPDNVRPIDVCPIDARPNNVGAEDDRPVEPNSDQDQSESSGFNLTPPVVVTKGANQPTFVISFRSQKEIVSALAWKSTAMVCGGTAITLLAFYLLRT